MRGTLFLGMLLTCAACHAQNLATTNNASAVRFVFNGFERAPDGRLVYLFMSQNAAETNRVFMGETIGGHQLLGFSPSARKLTLANSNGRQILFGAGDSFVFNPVPQTQAASVVASAANLPQGGASIVSHSQNEIRNSVTDLTVSRSAMVAVPSVRGRGFVHQNDFFFGKDFMYPTRFEVTTFPFAMPGSGVQYRYPVVIPRDFRTGHWGMQGTTRTP